MGEFNKAVETIHRRYGPEALMRLGDEPPPVDVLPTGSLGLDIALGVGGLPRGRVTEIYGPEMSGKTTIALHTVAEAQKAGGRAVFVDAEHALDGRYAARCGVALDDLWLCQPSCGEEALDIVERLVRSGDVDVVVVDSVSALVPRAEIEGEMGDAHMGLQARLMSQALRKLSGALRASDTVLIFVNQIRHKIGVFFGSPETTSGGLALRFYASVRLDCRRVKTLKSPKGRPVGIRVRVKVVKNKVAPPLRQAEFDILYDCGISREAELVDLGVTVGILSQRGGFFYLDGEQVARGRDQMRKLLTENADLVSRLRSRILEEMAARDF